jgi:hypothetical protein
VVQVEPLIVKSDYAEFCRIVREASGQLMPPWSVWHRDRTDAIREARSMGKEPRVQRITPSEFEAFTVCDGRGTPQSIAACARRLAARSVATTE